MDKIEWARCLICGSENIELIKENENVEIKAI